VVRTQEALVILRGRLRVDLYSKDCSYLESRILEAHDTVLLVAGGHGFKVLDAVEKGAAAFDLATAESPRFTGRCIAALAQDPDIMRKTGGIYQVAELATEYGFTDPDREMSA